MVIAISITAIAKKVLEYLASNKKGRKFLGYVIGIALFIVLLPLIASVGLFGWMAGGGNMAELSQNDIISQLPSEYQEQIEQYSAVISEIESVFSGQNISEDDTQLAVYIYLSCLTGYENDEDFYRKYADCFKNTGGGTSVLDNISDTFGVTFSDEDTEKYNNIYGGTQ